MYARVTSYQCDPSRLDEMTARIDAIRNRVKEISGVVTVYSAWRADGSGVSTAIYQSQADAEAAAPQAQAIWADLADLLVGPPTVETYENVVHMTE